MCGIVGYFQTSTPAEDSIVSAMAERIAHRGPDGSGAWSDSEAGISLGHRRLAILDLSPAGHQPMISADGRYILVFNGEIYNHQSIRAEIDAASWSSGWRGHSDTETLLAALQLWGCEAVLKKLNGMFAFALWDRERRVLTLARDRAGEKPLFYGTLDKGVVFGSELRALAAHPNWRAEIDPDVLALYLRHGYVPDPHCIYRGIKKLPPAHWVEIDANGWADPVPYWELGAFVTQERRTGSPEELLDELEERLFKAVGMRMVADVPLGAFLSGGIDSSVVVALMQAQSSQPVKTFTIGFEIAGFNEAEHAKAIASHLGTDHTELYLTPKDALKVVPDLPVHWDEPFADSSQIPTLLLSKMTREHVSVALSGDGGDELFCGYKRYEQGYALHQRLKSLPGPLRMMLSSALSATPVGTVNRAMSMMPLRYQNLALGDRLRKLGDILHNSEGPDFYRRLLSIFQSPAALVPGAQEAASLLGRNDDWPDLDDFREMMMYLDTMTYLPGDILTKVDRASMAVSLEARVPFLDHELMEFAWSLPLDLKLRDGKAKWPLQQILGRHVPAQLFDRPKMGFGVPIEHWLSGPLRDWAEDLLSEASLSQSGLLDPLPIRKLWTEHVTGQRRWHHQIWAILMFQAWYRTI